MVQNARWLIMLMPADGFLDLENRSQPRRRRRPATTEPGEKDENREVVNVKPKDSDSDAAEDDDQGEKAPHPQAEGDEPVWQTSKKRQRRRPRRRSEES